MRFLLCGILPAILLFSLPLGAKDADVLHFRNGDMIHGSFHSIGADASVGWLRGEWEAPATFKSSTLLQILFNENQPQATLSAFSRVHLSNGDVIPGELVGLDATRARIKTRFAGELAFPRQYITRVSAKPHGGKFLYYGPTNTKGWSIPGDWDSRKTGKETASRKTASPPDAKSGKHRQSPAPWLYRSGGWYSRRPWPLLSPAKLPGQVRIRFTLEWLGQLSAQIAFHAELPAKKPVGKKKPAKHNKANIGNFQRLPRIQRLPRNALFMEGRHFVGGHVPQKESTPLTRGQYAQLFGKCYVLQLHGNYISLQRCQPGQHGNSKIEGVARQGVSLQFRHLNKARFEIRCDRKSKLVSLCVDGVFITQWIDSKGYFATGESLLFANQYVSRSVCRLSRLSVTSWEGNPDSALSMAHPRRDTVLLDNGTDRCSGAIKSVKNGRLHLASPYAKLNLPFANIVSIHLAGEKTKTAPAPAGKSPVIAFLNPSGHLTLDLKSGDKNSIQAHHPILGNMSLSTDFLSRLLLHPDSDGHDHWNFP